MAKFRSLIGPTVTVAALPFFIAAWFIIALFYLNVLLLGGPGAAFIALTFDGMTDHFGWSWVLGLAASGIVIGLTPKSARETFFENAGMIYALSPLVIIGLIVLSAVTQ